MPDGDRASPSSTGPPGGLGDRSHDRWIGLAALLTLTVFARAPWTFFSGDDIVHLSRAAGHVPWNGPYRPLSEGLAFWVQYRIFGLDPLGYHLMNLGLHVANVTGVYWMCHRLAKAKGPAISAGILFGCSSIAFAPLHWATGIVELLACALLLAATHVHLGSSGRSRARPWLAALLALAAMGSKETALMWPAWIAWIEWQNADAAALRTRLHRMIPSISAAALFVLALVSAGHFARLRHSAAYATELSPGFVLQNLLTYLGWIAARWDPIPDRVAAVDPSVLPAGVVFLVAMSMLLWIVPPRSRRVAIAGIVWFLAFLVPVLPLASHSYLYYLYVPWVGGAITLASLGSGLLARLQVRAPAARGLTAAALALFVSVEAVQVAGREAATRDGLPVDRIMREALLLRNALPSLHRAGLPPGSRVGFVNPVPGPRFDLMSDSVTDSAEAAQRTSYWALEGAMHGGATFRLFVPQLEYHGFGTRIPGDRRDIEWFHFEQRGWLEHWGRGDEALLHQARLQIAAGQRSFAESTLARIPAGTRVNPSVETRLRALDRTGGAAVDTLLRLLEKDGRMGAT